MSYSAMKWARAQSLPTSEKFVLFVMADYAREGDDVAFPSVGTLMADTGMSERTVQRARKALEKRGLIVKAPRYGQSGFRLCFEVTIQGDGRKPVTVSVNPSQCHPVTVSPQTDTVPPLPDTVSPPPNHHLTTIEPDSIPPAPQSKKSTASKRGTRLPDNWQPSSALIDYANERNLNPQRESEDFRDYWCSKPGAGGMKLDWAATFRTWCRRSADRQQQRFLSAPNITPFPRPLSQSEQNRRASIERIRARQEARRHAQ